MVEEGDAQIRAQLAQVGRHHPQVVVVQPDDGAFGGLQRGAFGEGAVDLEEYLPVVFVEGGAFPEGVQSWPEGFLGEALVEDIDFFLAQLDPRGGELGITLGVHGGVAVERFVAILVHGPGDPGTGAAVAEEAEQGGDDAVGRGRPATLQLAGGVAVFLIGQAMINHYQLGLTRLRGLAAFGGDTVLAKEAEMGEGFEDAAAARTVGVQGARMAAGGLQQRAFRLADADAVEAGAEHGQVIERIAGGQHLVVIQFEPVGQRLQAAALVHPFGQKVQVQLGGVEQVAAQFIGDLA